MQTETISNLRNEIKAKEAERQKIARDTEDFLKFGRNHITVVPGFVTVSRNQTAEEKRLFNTPHPEERKNKTPIRSVAFVVKKHKNRSAAE